MFTGGLLANKIQPTFFLLQDDKREELPSLTLKEMPKALKELFIDNPTFVFLVIFTSLEFFQISAGTAFLPKMTAVQFRISPAKVSLLYGLIVVPAAALGHLFGMYIVASCRIFFATTNLGRFTLCDLYHAILLYYYAEIKDNIYELVNSKGAVHN